MVENVNVIPKCIGHSNGSDKMNQRRCDRNSINGSLYCQRHLANIPKIKDQIQIQRNYNIGYNLYKAMIPRTLIDIIRSYDYEIGENPLKIVKYYSDNISYNYIVNAIIVSKDSMITCEASGFVKLWDLTKCVCVKHLNFNMNRVIGYDIVNNKYHIIVDTLGSVKSLDPVSFKEINVIKKNERIRGNVCVRRIKLFSTNSQSEKIVALTDDSIEIWTMDTNNPECVELSYDHQIENLFYVSRMELHADLKNEYPDIILCTYYTHMIMMCKYLPERLTYEKTVILTHDDYISDIKCKNDKIYSCSDDGIIKISNIDGTLISSITGIKIYDPHSDHSINKKLLILTNQMFIHYNTWGHLGVYQADGQIIKNKIEQKRDEHYGNVMMTELPDGKIMIFQGLHVSFLEIEDNQYLLKQTKCGMDRWFNEIRFVVNDYQRIIYVNEKSFYLWK